MLHEEAQGKEFNPVHMLMSELVKRFPDPSESDLNEVLAFIGEFLEGALAKGDLDEETLNMVMDRLGSATSIEELGMMLYEMQKGDDDDHGEHEARHPFERVMAKIGMQFPDPENTPVTEIVDWILLELSLEISEGPLEEIAGVLRRAQSIYELSAIFYNMMYADMGKETNPIEGLMMLVSGTFGHVENPDDVPVQEIMDYIMDVSVRFQDISGVTDEMLNDLRERLAPAQNAQELFGILHELMMEMQPHDPEAEMARMLEEVAYEFMDYYAQEFNTDNGKRAAHEFIIEVARNRFGAEQHEIDQIRNMFREFGNIRDPQQFIWTLIEAIKERIISAQDGHNFDKDHGDAPDFSEDMFDPERANQQMLEMLPTFLEELPGRFVEFSSELAATNSSQGQLEDLAAFLQTLPDDL